MAPGVHVRSDDDGGSPRRDADPQRISRRSPREEEQQEIVKITTPATGAVLTDVPSDGIKAVRAKYDRARSAQPRWAAQPLRKRIDTVRKFKEQVIERQETLARTLTKEVGKPIRQSRNELKGLLARLDFFIAESARALRDETVLARAEQKLEERISHEPLGVIANISAWNYPYFVGSNVFVPALVAGNVVLYKPSEFAAMTGLEIARLLHEAGIPEDAFIALIGAGEVGAALVEQP